ncbi:BspA family leucine-rich repeat surface protein, partial [Allomuricauda sp. F6463D]|uniref:BspA family leucine-rich repeat surface protein n=1 Tax=Allomuricauda sp. F6463D TaxID=2926409 RepID=UPI001FF13A72
SLADGKELDFETAEEHVLTVTVTDGTESVDATITITVVNVIESMFEDPASFITTWEVPENNSIVSLNTNTDFDYDFTVDWGDGTIETVTDNNLSGFSHEYETEGTYSVAIQGDFPTMRKPDFGDTLKSIDQWGTIVWKTFAFTFEECINMVYNAIDTPNLENVTRMSGMFFEATSFNGDISGWDVSNVTQMDVMFYGATSFNQDLSNWDVSSVTSMFTMFFEAESFDQNLGAWNINSVTSMKNMFNGSGLSPQNFTATLVGWEAADNTPDNITLGADNIQLCDPEAVFAYNTLIIDHNWVIDFAGSTNCN